MLAVSPAAQPIFQPERYPIERMRTLLLNLIYETRCRDSTTKL